MLDIEQEIRQDRRGFIKKVLGGTIQNDMLKEFVAQKTFMCPPEPSVRIVTDTVEFGTKEVPRWNTISISGYHMMEAGANSVLQTAFTLADGVKFHDGSALTAEDVVWTFDRLRDPEVGSATVDLYSNIADITATEANVVTFVLAEPNPFFLYDLSDNHALVLKSGTEDPGTAFNGTGPFKVGEYSPEDRLVMAANEDYFTPDQPKLAGLEFIFFNDQTAQVEALRSGQVDLVMAISTDLFTSLEEENEFLLHWETNVADTRIHGTTKRQVAAMVLTLLDVRERRMAADASDALAVALCHATASRFAKVWAAFSAALQKYPRALAHSSPWEK